MRATSATWLAKAGTSEPLIASLLGHKLTQTVTQQYIRFPEVPGEVVAKLDGLISMAEGSATDQVSESPA